jgi:hypothetical protein
MIWLRWPRSSFTNHEHPGQRPTEMLGAKTWPNSSLGAVQGDRSPVGFSETEGSLTGMGTKESRMTQLGTEDLCPIDLEVTYPQKGTSDNTQEVGFGAFD